MVMVLKLTRLTHKIAIQLQFVAESSTICSSRSRRPVPKLLYRPSFYKHIHLRKMSVKTVGGPVDIRTGYFPNINLELYSCTNMAGFITTSICSKTNTF